MAKVFLSYKMEDREVAQRIQRELELLGHTIRVDTNSVVVGSEWRDSLMRSLMDSDAVVVLVTERSIQSPFVVSEIGAARAFGQTPKKMALLPIIFGSMPIPPVIQDLYVIRVANPTDPLKVPASDIDRALKAHAAQIEDRRSASPRVFISHRHKDEEIAAALVDVIQAAFIVDRSDIRCTSVRPFKLPGGERTPDRLREELKNAQVVIGIVTPDTKDSSYVLFELGGAWAQKILTFPMLARGGSMADLPDPIRDINPMSLEDARDCQQFLDDLEDQTTLSRKSGVGGDIADKVGKLVAAAKVKNDPTRANKAGSRQGKGR
jgi:hypothetical protein